MPVKPLRSVERALTVLEAIGAHMPIGVAALARLLDEDKSALQRVLVTLHGCGWIAPTDEDYTRWRLTTRPLLVTSQAQDRSEPLQRVRAAMDALRDELDETMFMVVPEHDQAVIVHVLEGRNLVRIAPHVGLVLPMETSAAGQAIAAPDRGWTVDHDVVADGATCVAAAVVEGRRVHGAIVVGAPTNRMGPRRQKAVGALLVAASTSLR